MEVDGVPIPLQVAYWVRKYVRYWQTHLRNIRRRFRNYGTGYRRELSNRRDDTRPWLRHAYELGLPLTKRVKRGSGFWTPSGWYEPNDINDE